MDLSILIPCYNEEEAVPNLNIRLNQLETSLKNKRIKYQIVFVDDGSKDKTRELLNKLYSKRKNVRIIKHEKNGNIGTVFKTGLENISSDYIATFDADCTYDIFSIENMYLIARKENLDLITVSPYHPKGGVVNLPKSRLFLSKSTSIIYKFLSNSNINTFTALNRVYKTESIKKINFRYTDFIFNAEILIKALFKGYKISEYPTKLYSRIYGQSKMKLLKVIKGHLKFMISVLFKTI